MGSNNMDGPREAAEERNVSMQLAPTPPRADSRWAQLRERLDNVTAHDVEECRSLFDILERMRVGLGLKKWSSLKGYVGEIPRCVRAVGGKGR
jgi:hypothetical protein